MVLARKLKGLPCDYIAASSGGAVPEQKIALGPEYQVPFAERIRKEAGIPTIAVGLITEPRHAEEILAKGSADLVALGRGMLYNPRWPWHAGGRARRRRVLRPQYERSHPSMRRGDFFKVSR